jgi:hypothetical protein
VPHTRNNGWPIGMRKPRQCRRGWFYVNPTSIDVVTEPNSVGIATLNRRQLIAALGEMKRFERTSGDKS